MTPLLAHIGGVPFEETAAALVPIGFALLAAARASSARVRRLWRRD